MTEGKLLTFFTILTMMGFMILTLACGPVSQQQTIHQVKIQLIIEPGQTHLEDESLDDLFGKALITGAGLGYRVLLSNKEERIISFSKEVSPEHVPINLNVLIQRENGKSAYAEIIQQSPRSIDNSKLIEFKNIFLSKIKDKKETPSSPAASMENQVVLPSSLPPVENKAEVRPQVAEEEPIVYLIALKNLNLRSVPNAGGKIITTLKVGDKIEKIGESNDWLRVKSSSGNTGWIFKDLAKEFEKE